MAIRKFFEKRESIKKKTRQGQGRRTKFSHKKGAKYKKKSRGQGSLRR